MGKFTAIPKDTFDGLQMDAGVVLRKFDPANPSKTTVDDIITATTGGVNAVCQPTYSDLGEDVDNCPVNMMELKHLDSWACTLGFTALGTSAESIRMELGAADIDAESGKITPRRDLKQTDFTDEIWWVGDKANGGFVAVCLKHALSTDGFSLQTTKSGKGQISTTLTGHVSLSAQDEVPMTFYSIDVDSSSTETTKYTVTFYDPTGATVLGTEEVTSGSDATASAISSSGNTITGWATTASGAADENALKNVTANRSVYAVYGA